MSMVAVIAVTTDRSRTLTPEQRAMALTIEDVEPWLYEHTVDPGLEEIEVEVSLFDESLEYTYEAPDVFLSTEVERETSVSSAEETFGIATWAFDAMLNGQEDDAEYTWMRAPEIVTWGDEQLACKTMDGDDIVGFFVIARKGRLVFNVTVSGVYFGEDDAVIRDLLKPIVETAERERIVMPETP